MRMLFSNYIVLFMLVDL